ncbi:DNA ligase 4 isoform X2 [Battus philenor]|uniref:DNA ligase 4 isoform X2 n=1 Tax=Battus philenor TaxID=42288 RepID=UPI0035CF9811
MTSTNVLVPANEVLFEDLCAILDKIVNTKKKYEKSMILVNFIDDFKIKAAQITEPKDASFYPILRLLLPSLERERHSYNLKERRLGNKLVQALAWDESSQNARMLLNYRSSNQSQTDFATVASNVLKYTVCETSNLTVGDINEILDNIANVTHGKSPSLEDIFTTVIKKINPRQLKWLLRIILKDLKLNMGQTRIFAALDADAENYYNYCNNLKRIHMKDNVFQYFTRKGHDIPNFGTSYESGMLTPLLKGCFASDVESFILDGEMLGWNEEQGEYGSKGMNFDVKALKDDSVYKPSFVAFDILYYNGQSLVGPPENGGVTLMKRLDILDKVFQDVPEVITHSKWKLVKQNSDILDAFNKSVDEDKEGITVKDTESYYLANRRGSDWYKIKGEYTKSTIQDLDLVIIGKTRSRRFYVACVDNSGASARWLCMASVGHLGWAQYSALSARLQPHWRRAADYPPPSYLVFNNKHVDFWLPPENSVVLQIRASELVKSENYGTPYTLRFQRVIKVRYDKPVKDILTLQEFEEIISPNTKVVKLNKTINQEEIDSVAMIPHKKTPKKSIQVAEPFQSKPSGDVAVISQALRGRKICILSDDIDCSKADLIRIVESHGGKHTEKYGMDTWCCVAGRLTPYVKSTVTANAEIDIASTEWLRSLPAADEPCSLSPFDMLTMKKETKLEMNLYYDNYGDSYRNPIDVDTLKKCLDKMNYVKPLVYLTINEKMKVDKELFEEYNPFSFLRGCFLAFLKRNDIQSILARLYGANICDIDSSNVTHVIIPNMASKDIIADAKKIDVLLVGEEWLDTCFKEGRRVKENVFIVS